MFTLYLHRDAERTYRRLPKHVQSRCARAFAALQREPFRTPNVTRLHGELDGCYRVRIGSWRIIYEVDSDNGVIVVHDIGTRGNIY